MGHVVVELGFCTVFIFESMIGFEQLQQNLIVSLHTLLHVTETRRVFATGLNDCGQLGVSDVKSHAMVC